MRGSVWLASFAVLAVIACGGGSPMMMMSTPVKQQPLTGKINGVTFTAVSSTASGMTAANTGAPPGSKWIIDADNTVEGEVQVQVCD